MKGLLIAIFSCFLAISSIGQDLKPADPNLKSLQTPNNPTFHYNTVTKKIGMWKGTYLYNEFYSAKDVRMIMDSLALAYSDTLEYYRLLVNHDSLSRLDEKSYNSLTEKPNLAVYRLLTNHDSLSTLQEKSYNSLDNRPNLGIYRTQSNHDSLSTLQEKDYASLNGKPDLTLKADKTTTVNGQPLSANVTVTKTDVLLGNVTNDSQVKRSEMATANGVATLDGNGKLPSSQVPSLAIVDTYVITNAADRITLAQADRGDVAIASAENKSYILQTEPYSVLSNWQLIQTPDSPIQSVNGQVGNVSLTTTDISEGTRPYYTDSRVASNAAVTANTAKVTNATHTGDVTGATTLTLATVNSNVGTYNNVTINAKGLATGGSNVSYEAPLTFSTGLSRSGNTITNTITQYSHPSTHPASILVQDASNRFVTDTEKGTWNGKQAAITGLTANYLPVWDGGKLVNSLIKNIGNNVNINSVGTQLYGTTGKYINTTINSENVEDWPGIDIGYDSSGGGIIAGSTYGGLRSSINFWTYFGGWGERMRIANTGNVGIGYSTGTEIENNKLAVNGSGYFNGVVNIASTTPSTSPSTGALTIPNGGLGVGGALNVGGAAIFNGALTAYGNILSSGSINGTGLNIELSTTNAGYILGKSNGSNKWIIGSDMNITGVSDNNLSIYSYLGNIDLYSNGVRKVVVSPSGIEVIGSITAPSITLTTGAGTGKVLTSDGSGNASWATLGGAAYKGEMNGATGSGLIDGVGTTGWYYACSVAGTFNYGSGNITLAVGDQLYYNGSVWLKIPGAGSYTLPVATASTLGGVKQGSGTIISGDGTISVSTAYEASGAISTHASSSTAHPRDTRSQIAGSYLSSYTETDPIYNASSWKTTTNNSAYWNVTTNRSGKSVISGTDTYLYLHPSYFTSYSDMIIPSIKTINGNVMTGSGNITINGVTDHTALSNLAYATSGHIGFAATNGSSTQAFSTANLSVTGTVTANSTMTATNFILSSDRRYKTNIENIDFSKVDQIDLKQFTFISDSTNRRRVGAIAQEVEKILPELVYTDDKGMKAVAYIDYLIMKVAQIEYTYAAKIKELENRIKTLENEK